MSEAWSPEEAEAVVAGYFSILGKELRGAPFNKADTTGSFNRYQFQAADPVW